MGFEVGIIDEFEAAHELKGSGFGPGTQLHGHTYKVEVRVFGERISDEGVLCDIASLKLVLRRILQRINYTFLNEVDQLKNVNTTTEELARFIHSSLRDNLRDSLAEKLTVLVWENQHGYGAFTDSI